MVDKNSKNNEKKFVSNLADIETDYAQWYTDIVLKSELADYGPVKGTMVIRPYGYAIWEQIQSYLDKKIKGLGVKNAYYPMLIPESFLLKEKEHVEGFAPEVAIVTHAGGEELAERLVVRPTSETMVGAMYSKWIKSYRDLPYGTNQWCNVVRWEKTTRPFLRTSEFLWQEGHVAMASWEEAEKNALDVLDIYADMFKNLFAIPVIKGKKSRKETFAGAESTYTIEAVMKDGKFLQSGTSHNLGQNFAKAFDIKYLSKEGKLEYCYTSSWGVTTRMIGAIIMVHGDNRGLKLSPRVAPIQVRIIPIASQKAGVVEKCHEVAKKLMDNGIRVDIDESDNTPGWKFNECELKGIPLRLEIGPRDIENGMATAVRRDTLEKFTIGLDDIAINVNFVLDQIHNNMYEQALKPLKESVVEVNSLDELVNAVDGGKIALSFHCGEIECEQKLQDKTAIKSRCIYDYNTNGICPFCGKPAVYRAYFGKQY